MQSRLSRLTLPEIKPGDKRESNGWRIVQGEFMKDGHPGMSESVLAVVQQLSVPKGLRGGFSNALIAGWA
ncbi:MAG: hypothetical protein KGS61_12295, partial [Verrucomicrobia bacterium]|nr:hypothetical protein [Verrucomicrobiota bacterium]